MIGDCLSIIASFIYEWVFKKYFKRCTFTYIYWCDLLNNILKKNLTTTKNTMDTYVTLTSANMIMNQKFRSYIYLPFFSLHTLSYYISHRDISSLFTPPLFNLSLIISYDLRKHCTLLKRHSRLPLLPHFLNGEVGSV